ncbi:FdtA/QdtA family cupin domain-containing protein [Acidobacteriota bacterium]
MNILKTTVADCKLIDLPQVANNHIGRLTYVYGRHHVPFDVARVYYLYDVPGGAVRAAHAHKELHQILVAVSGSFDVQLDDGSEMKSISLNRPYYGILIPPYIWRTLVNFSSGSVCLTLASLPYDEADYIHDYNQLLKLKKEL